MAVFEDGLAGVTTSTGTGNLAVTGDIPGYREISQLADGQARVFVVRTATDFEVALLTKSGGSSPVLARTTVYMNRSGTSAAVNWGAGEKTIHSTISAAILAALNDAGVRTAHLILRGMRVAFDEDDDSYLYSDADDNIVGVIGNVEVLRLFNTDPRILRLQSTDSGVGVDPVFIADRASPTPAPFDVIGGFWATGRSSTGATRNYARLEGMILDPTDGAESGQLVLSLLRSGASLNALFVGSAGMQIYPSLQSASVGVVVGKGAIALNTVGSEIRTNGVGVFTTNGSTCLFLNRKTSDGQIISINKDGSEVASVSLAAGVVTWGAFIGNHPSKPAVEVSDLQIGAVLCTVDEPFDPTRPHLPKYRPSETQGDKRVYGVFAGTDEKGEHLINAIGSWVALVTGPVQGGDLLWTSAVPGVAEVQPDDIWRAHTLGKVSMGDDRTDTRLVAITLKSG